MNAAGVASSVGPIQIDNRKDFLLLLLAAPGESGEGEPIVGVTRLQKYLFLLQQECEWDKRFNIREPYRFEAYNYGPFDSQLYDDLQLLENAGLVERQDAGPEPLAENDEARQLAYEWGTVDPDFAPWEEENRIYRYVLTPRGRDFVQRYQLADQDWQLLASLKRWNKRPLQELLRWLYKKYPQWAENTKLKHLRG